MANITFDASSFNAGVARLLTSVEQKRNQGVQNIATEILRLSQFEVPHDLGTLQNSGHVEPGADESEVLVGYNTPYAAYQHEGVRADGTHPIHQWQGGRKGKYLEDPINNNLETFKTYLQGVFEQ